MMNSLISYEYDPGEREDFSRNPFKSTIRQYPCRASLPDKQHLTNTYSKLMVTGVEIPKPLTVNIPEASGGSLDYAVKTKWKGD